jgi:methenyltetrahydromethanopterin cyclohydrolase
MEVIEKKIEDTLTPVQPSAQIISFVEIEARVVLYKAMYCLVHAYDAQRVKIKIFQVEITPEEYETWTSDVEMEALILSKCGLVKS